MIVGNQWKWILCCVFFSFTFLSRPNSTITYVILWNQTKKKKMKINKNINNNINPTDWHTKPTQSRIIHIFIINIIIIICMTEFKQCWLLDSFNGLGGVWSSLIYHIQYTHLDGDTSFWKRKKKRIEKKNGTNESIRPIIIASVARRVRNLFPFICLFHSSFIYSMRATI